MLLRWRDGGRRPRCRLRTVVPELVVPPPPPCLNQQHRRRGVAVAPVLPREIVAVWRVRLARGLHRGMAQLPLPVVAAAEAVVAVAPRGRWDLRSSSSRHVAFGLGVFPEIRSTQPTESQLGFR